jgi:hypothetical protein
MLDIDDFELYLFETKQKKFLNNKEMTCVLCPHLHCDYYETYEGDECPLAKEKNTNPYRKLNNYVYLNLKQYGNSIICSKKYTAIGREEIFKDLKSNGFTNITIDSNLIVTAKYDRERDNNAYSDYKSLWRDKGIFIR